MLRCGRIIYTNDLPIYAAFDESVLEYPGTLHADVPAKLNAMMLAGELDLSPISAFAYARNPEQYVLLPDLCIGARDEVISVVLVSAQPPALLAGAKIAATSESATGRNLLRLILERRYGVDAQLVETEDALAAARTGQPALLIGDHAIDALFEFSEQRIYDVGRLWHEWTGEQTVFAVWAARREAYDSNPQAVRACMDALTDSYTWARGHMRRVVGRAQSMISRPAVFYERYFSKLNFTFHSAAQRGLARYYRELQAIGAIDAIPPLVPETFGVTA